MYANISRKSFIISYMESTINLSRGEEARNIVVTVQKQKNQNVATTSNESSLKRAGSKFRLSSNDNKTNIF